MSPGTFEAASRAAGGAVRAVDEVMTGAVTNAFVAMRPPGHHAEHLRAMGFCFFNNAAIAARHAQTHHGAGRVAILDWDVHHGNGTQDIFWSDPSVLYCSTHEMPLYPGTGAASERGDHGTILNAPMASGDGSDVFRDLMDRVVLPRIAAFRPDLLIVSAGFDAHWRDPLAGINLTEADFGWATQRVMALADTSCGNRIVSVLEGGYDLDGLARSASAHVDALMGRKDLGADLLEGAVALSRERPQQLAHGEHPDARDDCQHGKGDRGENVTARTAATALPASAAPWMKTRRRCCG